MKWELVMSLIVPLPNGMVAVNPPPDTFISQIYQTKQECDLAGLKYIMNNPTSRGVLRHNCFERTR